MEQAMLDLAEVVNDLKRRILRDVAHMDQLVLELLDASSLDAGHLVIEYQSVDIHALIERVLERIVPELLRPRVLVDVKGATVVLCDGARIERLLANLIDNAFKHAPPGSPIIVRVCPSGPSIRIEVIDRGPGVRPGELEHILGRHGRGLGPNGRKGTGFGLFLSRRIVEAHGGRLGYESVPGGGACFFIELPARTSESSGYVLIVDDELAQAADLAERLREGGCTTALVASIGDALTCVRRRPPRAVIVDARTRGRASGIELLARVSSDHPDVECYLLTGTAPDEPWIAKLSRRDGSLHLDKPIAISRVLEVLGVMSSSSRA